VTLKRAYEIRGLVEAEIRPEAGIYLPDAAEIVASRHGLTDQEVWDAWHGTCRGETRVFLDDLRALPEGLYREVSKLLLSYLAEEYTLEYIVNSLVHDGKEAIARELCRVLGFVKNPFGWEV
jgi:hypothetical protein